MGPLFSVYKIAILFLIFVNPHIIIMFHFKARRFKLKDGRNVLIRESKPEDVLPSLALALEVFHHSPFVLTLPHEFTQTPEQQREWYKRMREAPNNLLLYAELEGQLVGMLDFSQGRRQKVQHMGEFGMSVKPGFQGLGIGKALLTSLIDAAKDNEVIEKLVLLVFEANEPAVKLYESLGFQVEGHFLRHSRQPDGEYHTLLQMYLFT
jgi:RimJ/RimL family protein N-acetyltransferase